MLKTPLHIHEMFMERALDLARRGEGYTNPNPLVGALIVRDGMILAEGYHAKYGGDHAEIEALKSCPHDCNGAVMYVTLEPCCHTGKTPPCTEAIIESGISKVVIGCCDPNPLVSGKGIARLREAGIQVENGILEKECRKLNEVFFCYMGKKRPFCILKSAMTLDGKIAAVSGDSKWVSCEKSREYVHRLRHRCSAVMTGIGTVLADNPSLTTRLKDQDGIDAHRIIVDSHARIPLSSHVVRHNSPAQTIVAVTDRAKDPDIQLLRNAGVNVIVIPSDKGRVDLSRLMRELYSMGIDSVLLEGGGTLNSAALESDIIDKILVFVSAKIIGGASAMTLAAGKGRSSMGDAIPVYDITHRVIGEDILIEGYLSGEGKCSQD